ncbi:MAG: sugar ABC transporter [Cyanobacteria bacterium M_surface_10_m2_119]|nr:sugar ABC transporter [Cyanobacteria bacterium M_surface_10_m2_119]
MIQPSRSQFSLAQAGRSPSGRSLSRRRRAGERLQRLREWADELGQRVVAIVAFPGSAEGEEVGAEDAASDRRSSTSLRSRLRAPLEPMLRLPVPALLAGVVVLGSALYFFGIGRNRYTVPSSFIVRLPEAPVASGSSLLGTTLAGPTMLGSLEDGRFLAVYLTSPEVMKRVFLKLQPESTWGKRAPDPFAGLRKGANFDQQLSFFRRQVYVVPQDLTGVINLTTVGLAPEPSYRLNRLLLDEAEQFLNRVNQSISANQQSFSEQETVRARQRLDKATEAFNAFKNQYGEVNPALSAQGASNYLTQLESKLVELKVEEASLKRQFLDPNSPEVATVTDQVRELERQISEERALLVGPDGKDFNTIVAEGSKLETEVTLATEALKSAINSANNNRQRTQQQVKFLVRLAEPAVPQMQNVNWRWQGFLAVLGILVVLWGLGTFALGIVDRR